MTSPPQGVPVTLPANASTLATAAYVSNGLLTVGLRGVNGSNATVANVSVVPSGNSRLVAVAAGSPQDVLSGRGIVFSRDQYFTGGLYFNDRRFGLTFIGLGLSAPGTHWESLKISISPARISDRY